MKFLIASNMELSILIYENISVSVLLFLHNAFRMHVVLFTDCGIKGGIRVLLY